MLSVRLFKSLMLMRQYGVLVRQCNVQQYVKTVVCSSSKEGLT